MVQEALHIGVSENSRTRVIRLSGELDSYTSHRLADIADTWIPGAKKIVVSLDGLQYIDSSGLSALVGMWVAARDNGVAMVVSCHKPRIYRVLEITGLLNLFDTDRVASESSVMQSATYQRPASQSSDPQRSAVQVPAPSKDLRQ